jgi:hypothetical protein
MAAKMEQLMQEVKQEEERTGIAFFGPIVAGAGQIITMSPPRREGWFLD